MSLELGRLVEHRRHELGMTRRDLAERADVSYPYVSQIETGDRDPSLKTLRRLATALETPVESLASLVTHDHWMTTDEMMSASASAPMMVISDQLEPVPDLYRDKVLPFVERRLATVPPLIRIELLNELIAKAIEELRQPGQ